MNQIDKKVKQRFVSLPMFWFGLLIAFIPIILIWIGYSGYSIERMDAMGNVVDMTPANPMYPYAFIVIILSFVYWLLCVCNLHKDIRKATIGEHNISPNKAAFLHLIPLWNLYWVFKWTKEIACTFNKTNSQNMSKWLYGASL